MSEFFTWQMAQFILAAAVTGGTIGVGTYEYEHYRPPYQESTYRETTYTGKGQFRCQTGCPSPMFITQN